MKSEVEPRKEELAQALFDNIPVGVGARGIVPMNSNEIDEAIVMGMDWCEKKGISWPEDRLHCEELGKMPNADASKVSERAKMRGRRKNVKCELLILVQFVWYIAAAYCGTPTSHEINLHVS